MSTRISANLLIDVLVVCLTCCVVATAYAQTPVTVNGLVMDTTGPVTGATVRVRNTELVFLTDDDGYFTIANLAAGQEIEITAWAEDYYIAYTHVTPPAEGVILTLRRFHTEDHVDYEWASPIAGTSDGACGDCHPMILEQWLGNAHGQAISNARFYSLYNGTSLSGEQKVGRGYVDDFPGTAGNCAQCHAPGAGINAYLTVDMNNVRDDMTAGIHCDYCHKIGGVYLNPATDSVYPNAPGAQSTRMLRPPEDDNIFFGPYDDIHDPDTRLPLISESAFCAPCHQFSMWGTPIYESYNEWLASPYAETGITCQDCHMPPNGDAIFALPAVGGLEHPPETIPSHLQLGVTSEALLQNTVEMEVDAQPTADGIMVTVAIRNTGAGHHIPTDHPGRHMILTVEALDEHGSHLTLIDGSEVPVWGGEQAGQPGTAFAKILQDAMTGEQPVVSYWRQCFIVEDTRLSALATHTSQYLFEVPNGDTQVAISVKLIFRQLFQEDAELHNWSTPDTLMASANINWP